MELRQLRAFIKAAETKNFSVAAKDMFVTQSTFSQSIKKLEDELNIQLFYRNTHEVALTEAGNELLPFARETVRNADACVDRVNDLMNLKKGTLNIGVTHTFSLIASKTIMQFAKEYPGVKLNIFFKTMDELMDMLSKREVDFVLSYKPSKVFQNIESHILFEDRLAVVVKKGHPLTEYPQVTLEQIMNYPLALPAKGLQARNVLDTVLEKRDVELNSRIEFNEVTPLLALVSSGELVTILSTASIESCSDLTTIPIDSDDCQMSGSFHILKDSYRKLSAKEFIRMLCQNNIINNSIYFSA